MFLHKLSQIGFLSDTGQIYRHIRVKIRVKKLNSSACGQIFTNFHTKLRQFSQTFADCKLLIPLATYPSKSRYVFIT
jgi:hypothetical protein